MSGASIAMTPSSSPSASGPARAWGVDEDDRVACRIGGGDEVRILAGAAGPRRRRHRSRRPYAAPRRWSVATAMPSGPRKQETPPSRGSSIWLTPRGRSGSGDRPAARGRRVRRAGRQARRRRPCRGRRVPPAGAGPPGRRRGRRSARRVPARDLVAGLGVASHDRRPTAGAVKTTDRSYPIDDRCGATAIEGDGPSSRVLPTTLFGSATTMPAAMRYLASIGCVHS